MTTADLTTRAHPALAAASRLHEALDEVAGTSRVGFDRDDALALSVQLYRLQARLDALTLSAVGELDLLERGALVATGRGRYLTATTLQQTAGLDRVRAVRDVRTAQALRDHLPEVAHAYGAGDITREHVDVARRVPDAVKPSTWREHGAAADATLADQARQLDPTTYKKAAEHLLDVLDPSRLDGREPHLDDRSVAFTRGEDGCGHLRMLALPGDAALLQAVFDARATVQPVTTEVDDDGRPYEVEDARTTAQRQYDALMDVVRAGVAGGEPDGPGLAPEIRVITTESQLAGVPGSGQAQVDGYGGVSFFTVQQHACTGILRRVRLAADGGPLDVGCGIRYATTSQRAALDVRDRGCVIPGCTKPAKVCHAHHVVGHGRGGPTALRNLALVCERHHREAHHGRWHLEITDGVVWVTARDDPHRRRVRNLRHRVHPLRS